jgi:hypothetical protein
VVLDGMAKGRQPSPLFVAVTSFGVVAATALLGGAVLVPELVPPVELLPVLGGVVLVPEVVPPVEPVPFGGVVEPADVLPGGGVVVPVVVPVVVLSAVDPPELAALLEPQALSAARQTIEIAGKSKTRSFDAKIIATCFHSLS